jgi:hypothetical protein
MKTFLTQRMNLDLTDRFSESPRTAERIQTYANAMTDMAISIGFNVIAIKDPKRFNSNCRRKKAEAWEMTFPIYGFQ